MSLSQKINEDMAALAYRIIQYSGKNSKDPRVQKMCRSYKELERLRQEAMVYEKKLKESETP